MLYKWGHCDLLNRFYGHFCEKFIRVISPKGIVVFKSNFVSGHLRGRRGYILKK